MKITAIKQQVKQKDRYSIFVDGKYAFSLGEGALLDAQLNNGQELTEQELKELKQQSADDKVYGLALRYVMIRQRSEWEIRNYLDRKKVSPALADVILNRLSKLDLVNDQKFAEAWINNRRLLRPTSLRKLQQELRAKRVSSEVIEQVLAEDEADEQDVLRELVAKKRARYPDRLKFMQYLARQGFGYEDIKRTLDEIAED
jgi:regulatory protein